MKNQVKLICYKGNSTVFNTTKDKDYELQNSIYVVPYNNKFSREELLNLLNIFKDGKFEVIFRKI